jgi:hypothetical protein
MNNLKLRSGVNWQGTLKQKQKRKTNGNRTTAGCITTPVIFVAVRTMEPRLYKI